MKADDNINGNTRATYIIVKLQQAVGYYHGTKQQQEGQRIVINKIDEGK